MARSLHCEAQKLWHTTIIQKRGKKGEGTGFYRRGMIKGANAHCKTSRGCYTDKQNRILSSSFLPSHDYLIGKYILINIVFIKLINSFYDDLCFNSRLPNSLQM